jgi:hypothetical protein
MAMDSHPIHAADTRMMVRNLSIGRSSFSFLLYRFSDEPGFAEFSGGSGFSGLGDRHWTRLRPASVDRRLDEL